jgi:hypothetical protein
MGPRRRSLEGLAACLRGAPRPDCNWLGIVEAANGSLVTPFLATALEGASVPDDVRDYVSLILTRNIERNVRLRAQMGEAAAALNAGGIVPTALKGGAWLMTATPHAIGQRLMTDLDIIVPTEEMPRALSILADLGYDVDSKPSDLSHHFQADLRRPSDAAMIDLHRRPPGPAAFHDHRSLQDHCTIVPCGDGKVLVPSATYQAFHVIAHDQFHDGDYWLGHIDLRHLVDLAILARSPGGIDFDHLASLMPGRLGRHALATQLVTLHRLLGVDVPPSFLRQPIARLQFQRRLVQLDLPVLRLPFTALTIASEWRAYREFGALNRAMTEGSNEGPARASGRRERWTRLLMSDGMGKV